MNLLRPAALPLALILAVPLLSGCKQDASPDKQQPSGAAIEAKPGLSITAARLVLPTVKGNPGAAYFAIENTGSSSVSLATISIEGAGKAEMHQTIGSEMTPVDRVDISAATNIAFEPGKLHAMVFGIADKLKAGGSTELTLTFSDGDKISTRIRIESASDAAMGTMGAMDKGSDH